MENNNIEPVKKTRRPRLPKLKRKFQNLQDQIHEIENEVESMVDRMVKTRSKVEPNAIDFSQCSTTELIELQARVNTVLLARSKDMDKNKSM